VECDAQCSEVVWLCHGWSWCGGLRIELGMCYGSCLVSERDSCLMSEIRVCGFGDKLLKDEDGNSVMLSSDELVNKSIDDS